MNNVTLVDLVNEEGVKKNLCNIDVFCNTVLDNPVVKYCTYDASQANKNDAVSIESVKQEVSKVFDDVYCVIPKIQSGGMNFSQVKQNADVYNERLNHLKFTNFYNPFSGVHEHLYADYFYAKKKILTINTVALGGLVLGALIPSIIPLIFTAVGVSPLEYWRKGSRKNAHKNLRCLEEALKKYILFQENLRNATIETTYFPEAEKKVATVRVKQQENASSGLPFNLDYMAFNNSLIDIYGVCDYR